MSNKILKFMLGGLSVIAYREFTKGLYTEGFMSLGIIIIGVMALIFGGKIND
jgi:hypothetical protein